MDVSKISYSLIRYTKKNGSDAGWHDYNHAILLSHTKKNSHFISKNKICIKNERKLNEIIHR